MAWTELVTEDHGQNDGLLRSSHLFEQIHELLWQKILSGEFLPEQRLKDTQLAKELGVSRTPVREAMRKMQQEGILIPLSFGGYQVRSVSLEDFKGLYQCRAVLEGLAAKEATARFSAEAKSRFDTLLDKVDEAIKTDDLDGAFILKTAFHNELVELSENVHLIGLFRSITKLILFYRSALLNRVKTAKTSKAEYIEEMLASQHTHRVIVETISAGDGEKARQVVEAHLLAAAEDIAQRLI